VGAVDNIMNFDGVTLDRARRLCDAADEDYRKECYRHIGIGIGVLVLGPEQQEVLCRQVDEPHRPVCLEGAGVGRAAEQRVTQTAPTTVASPPEPAMEETREVFDVGAEVRYEYGRFIPESVTIEVGQAVRWVNKDSETMWPASDVHPTHQEYPGFDVGRPIPFGSSYSFTFSRLGTWRYHNHMNPEATGMVVVVDRP
jgi:plastocyanin